MSRLILESAICVLEDVIQGLVLLKLKPIPDERGSWI